MENQTFIKKIEELLHGDTAIMIPNYRGRTWTLEGIGGRYQYRVGLFVHTQEKYRKDDKQLIVEFSIRDFMLECDRLQLNYDEMLKTKIKDLINSTVLYK